MKKSNIYDRKGDDIYVTVPLPLETAILGGTMKVPTIHGDVDLIVNPGTEPQKLKKLKRMGVRNGDQYVKFNLQIPKYRNLILD